MRGHQPLISQCRNNRAERVYGVVRPLFYETIIKALIRLFLGRIFPNAT